MKNEAMIGTRLPRALVKELERIERVEQADRSTTVRKLLAVAIQDWKLAQASKEYGGGLISLARAAREAGVSLWEMQTYLRDHKVPVQYDQEELQHDLDVIDAL